MAAGLSIQAENIPEFRRRLSRTVSAMRGDAPLEAALQVDGTLPLGEVTLELAADLERLGPFGAGNPALTLVCHRMKLEDHRSLGRNDEHRLLNVQDAAGENFKVVWWQGAGWPLPEGMFDLAYTLRASTYRGVREVQFEWVDARLIEEPVEELESPKEPIEVVDYRDSAHPLPILEQLQADGVQIWCEAEAREKLGGAHRSQLVRSAALAIWTVPPSADVLRQVLEAVSPQKVYLFGILPDGAEAPTFLQRLAGLVKYTLKAKQGRTTLDALAAVTAQRRDAVRLGLSWLERSGHIRVVTQQEDELVIAAGDGELVEGLEDVATRLKAVLQEAAAYRAFFLRADKDTLFK